MRPDVRSIIICISANVSRAFHPAGNCETRRSRVQVFYGGKAELVLYYYSGCPAHMALVGFSPHYEKDETRNFRRPWPAHRGLNLSI
jgi:hypothetical protein